MKTHRDFKQQLQFEWGEEKWQMLSKMLKQRQIMRSLGFYRALKWHHLKIKMTSQRSMSFFFLSLMQTGYIKCYLNNNHKHADCYHKILVHCVACTQEKWPQLWCFTLFIIISKSSSGKMLHFQCFKCRKMVKWSIHPGSTWCQDVSSGWIIMLVLLPLQPKRTYW